MSKSNNSNYFQKASRSFYFLAIISFSIILLLNQPGYFKNCKWGIVFADFTSVILIYTALFLYLNKSIHIKQASFVYAYVTLLDLIFSIWYDYFHHVPFRDNFLFTSFIYCINLVVAGFCIGRKHAFFSALLFVVVFSPLIYLTDDQYLRENAYMLGFLILAFSLGVSAFLKVLEKTHQEDLSLKEEIFEKNKALALESQNRLEFELETKRKEIVAKSMFMIEFAENHNILLEKLNGLKKELQGSRLKLLSEIIKSHQMDHQQKYWKDFELSFLNLHPDFYNKLNQINPELSPSELKLATLVHMGLSSKQIGNICSVTPESVDVARSRLRSKLNLPANANLKNYLMLIK